MPSVTVIVQNSRGVPFADAGAEAEEIAAIAAALQATLSPSTSSAAANGPVAKGPASVAQTWRAHARVEGLRGA
mgnify:CR=1 FL=1